MTETPKTPIFVGGLFKSGTSLLRAMLGQHSNIAAGLETYWFDLDWPARDGVDMQARIGRLAEFFDLAAAEVRQIAADSPSAETFVGRLLDFIAQREDKRRWAEKTPGNIVHADRILAAWPDASILHIVRDPRDVYASLRQAAKWDTVEAFSDRWCDFLGAAKRHKAELGLNAGNFLEVRYEALVTEPLETMRVVLAFLGEPFEEAAARFGGKDGEFEKVKRATGKASTTLKRLGEPMTKARVGIWRDVLEDGELDELKREIARRGLGDLYDRICRESAPFESAGP